MISRFLRFSMRAVGHAIAVWLDFGNPEPPPPPPARPARSIRRRA